MTRQPVSNSTVLPGSLVVQPRWEHVRFKAVGPRLVEARRSSCLVLTCSATGSPAPALAWYKDGLFTQHHTTAGQEEEGGSLGETVAELRIPCVEADSAGQWECRAVAGRSSLSAVTEVRVVDWEEESLCRLPAPPHISLYRRTVMVESGSRAVLPCRASAGAAVQWTGPTGQQLPAGPDGQLELSSVSWADMGEFTCTASSSAGSTTATTFLYPLSATD